MLFEGQKSEAEAWEQVEVLEWAVTVLVLVLVVEFLASIEVEAEVLELVEAFEWVDFGVGVSELAVIAAEVLGWVVAWLAMGVVRAAWLSWIQTF